MFLSILGMYEYDNSVFNGFQIPEGIDRDALINNILLNCAELELMYNNIDTMRLAISVWSISNLYTWEKLFKTTQLVYNPIWNVDADIIEKHDRDIKENGTGQNKNTRNFSDNETVNLTDKDTKDLTDTDTKNLTDTKTLNLTDTETPNVTDTHSVQGYNSTQWAPASKDEKTGTDTFTHTGTDTDKHTGTDTVKHTGTDTITHTGTDKIDHTGTDTFDMKNNRNVDDNTDITIRRTGNIGVTTTQKMIEEERSIAEFSIIEYITQSFKERFCLLVY